MSSDSYPRFLAQLESRLGGTSNAADYLEIRNRNGGDVMRRSLANHKRLLIGRGPEADLTLAGGTVSRAHAELLFDNHGLWWVQDLGSTNGTFVNGQPVKSQALSYGDAVGVGDYYLVLGIETEFLKPGQHQPSSVQPVAVVPPAPEPSRPIQLGFEQSIAASGFVSSLQHIAQVERRRQLLCEYASSNEFASNFSWIVEVTNPSDVKLTVGRVPQRLITQQSQSVNLLDFPSEARSIYDWCKRHAPTLLLARGPLAVRSRENPHDRVVVCPLSRSEERAELLCVRLGPSQNPDFWLDPIAFLVDGVQRSDELWRLRDDYQRTSKLQYEFNLANQIQQSLVPNTTRFKGIEVSFSFQPSRSVGGDYVDVVRLKDGRILLAIADVCGKGLQAALISISLHTLIHVLIDVSPNLSSLVRSVNQHLTRYLPDHSFVTMIVLAVDEETGQIEAINAGHPPALLLNVDGTLRELQVAKNVPLGVMEFEPEVESFTMTPHELLFMYTDGLTEARSPRGTLLGQDGLRALCTRMFREAPGSDLDMLKGRFEASVADYEGAQVPSDDRAFLLARLVDKARAEAKVMVTLRPPPMGPKKDH